MMNLAARIGRFSNGLLCLLRIEAEFLVKIAKTDRLQIEKAADGETTRHRRFVHQHGGEMTAGRPAADIEPCWITSHCRKMSVQPMQRGACLANNAGHGSLGRQGIARDRDIEAMGERSFGDEAEALLCVALPI